MCRRKTAQRNDKESGNAVGHWGISCRQMNTLKNNNRKQQHKHCAEQNRQQVDTQQLNISLVLTSSHCLAMHRRQSDGQIEQIMMMNTMQLMMTIIVGMKRQSICTNMKIICWSKSPHHWNNQTIICFFTDPQTQCAMLTTWINLSLSFTRI